MNNMDRDKLDNALLRKVEETRIEPPSDIWDRIAPTLMAKGLTASGDAAGTSSGTTEPARNNISKSKRVLWRYAAAAAVIVCVGIIGYRINRIGDPIVADGVQDGIAAVAVKTGIATEEESSLTNPAQTAAKQQVTAGTVAQATSDTDVKPDLNQYTEASEVEQTPKNTESDPVTAAPENAEVNSGRTRTRSSDMRSEGGVPVYAAHGAEAGRRAKRATPLTVSLYAGNFGTGKTVQDMNGGTMRAAASDIMMFQAGPNIMGSQVVPSTVSLKHKFPLSFGVTISTGLTRRLSAESGLVYSYLYSDSGTPAGNNQYKHEQKLHYLGIPVGMRFDLFERPFYNIYAGGGAQFEICVSGQYVQTLYSNGIAGASNTRRMNIYGIQSSVNMQVGAEFKMSKNLSLYLEPGVSYYIENERQPESYRTESPINMSLKAGIRFRMKKPNHIL